METELHRQLKQMYATSPTDQEVRLKNYRIDAVAGDVLVEIQFGSLVAIRDKIRRLVEDHRVLVVKPLAAKKVLVTCKSPKGPVVSRRTSPRKETLLSIFDELVYFVTIFPHPNLILEVLLTEQEEIRVPPKTRRRRRKSYEVCERKLVRVLDRRRLATCADLRSLLPGKLPEPFSTAQLAAEASIPRWLAQKICYCLRHTGTTADVGKAGNARLYSLSRSAA